MGLATAANVSAVPESRRIVRMNCLRTAAEMLKDSTLLPEQKLSLVTSIAGSPEQHVLRGARAEAAAPAPTETRHDGNGRKAREGGA